MPGVVPPPHLKDRIDRPVAIAILSVMALEIGARISGFDGFRYAAWVMLVMVTATSWRRLGFRESYLLALCVILAGVVAYRADDPQGVLAAALDQSSFLMAFIMLLGLLHEAASTSPSVAACGAYMTQQPPGRRYPALYIGAGVMAVLFNLGVVSFLVPLIQRGIKTANPDDPLNDIRERRQISALLRGFGWSVIWSPTAVAPLTLMQLIPGTDRRHWIVIGVVVYLVIMVMGMLEDYFRFRSYRPARRRPIPSPPYRAIGMFLAACAWLFGMSTIISTLTGDTIIFGLLVSCPIMLVGWVVVQNVGPGGGGVDAIGARFRTIAFENLPKAAPVAVTLACSGFIGVAAAALIPGGEVASALGFDAMPDFVLLGLIPIALTCMSLLALSPIMMAVFFGSLFGNLPVMPADPTLIALAISCGWALSMTFSPFATVVLMINRVGGIPTRTLTWGWNFGYSVLAAAVLFAVFFVLTGGR